MYSKTTASEVKFTHYPSDGTGRDTYIYNYNGGLWRQNQIKVVRPESGSYHKENRYRSPAPKIDSKINRYITNGSGRDGYISVDEGGFTVSIGRKSNFIGSLRSYDQTIRQRSITLQQSTAQMIKRLNQVKKTEDPYIGLRKLSSYYYKM